MNGIILVDKPFGKTSHDVAAILKRLLKTKKVGHTGTLDPLATGVLPICVGCATKASDMIMSKEKSYKAELVLGMTTDTGDCEGEILSQVSVVTDEEKIAEAVNSFVGEITQIPPMYSAIKQNGVKLYELARAGKTVKREPRQITIFKIDILNIDLKQNTVELLVNCSKGTYIRTLCEDIGMALHCGAYMNKLQRVSTGEFTIDQCHGLDKIREMADNGTVQELLIPVWSVFQYKKIYLNMRQASRMRDGVFVSHKDIRDGQAYCVFDEENNFLAVSRSDGGRLKIVKSFFS